MKMRRLGLIALCALALGPAPKCALAQSDGAPRKPKSDLAVADIHHAPEPPEVTATRERSVALITAGQKLFDAGNFAAAAITFRQAIAVGLNDPNAYIGLAESLNAQGKSVEALAAYRELIYELPVRQSTSSRDPEKAAAHRAQVLQNPTQREFGSASVRVWMNYAILLCQSGQWAEAAAFYQRAAARVPTGDGPSLALQAGPSAPSLAELEAMAYVALGVDYAYRLELEKAVAEYDQAWRLQPDSPMVNYYYGLTLKSLGRINEAKAAFRKAASLGSGDVKKAAEKALNN